VIDVASLTAELIALPSPSGREGPVLDRCERALADGGLRVERDRLGNVLAVAGSGSPRTLFDAHADTVAPNPGWTRDPHAGERDGDVLFGLGAVDMKGPLAALVLGVCDAAASGRLRGTVAVSVSTLEEVLEGATLAAAIDAFGPDRVVIAEPSDLRLATAQRGRAEIEVVIDGVAAHAAFPERGISALEAAAAFVGALSERQEPEDAELGRGILVATELRTEPSPGISVVPSRALVRLDRRTLPGEARAQVLAELEPALAAARATGARASARLTSGAVRTYTGTTLDEERFLPAWRLAPDDGWAREAHAALDATLGGVARTHYAFCTNGSLTAGARGIPTIGFGPGATDQAHRADEHVSIADLERGRRGYAALAGMTHEGT
jgi:putative selenium metabolism hydrolase